MDKPKFVMSKKEMLEFNDACGEAARHCPQFRREHFEDRAILLGEIPAKTLVKTWRKCDTLFSFGYAELLSEDAVDVFKRYKNYKADKQLWKAKKNT